MPYKPARPCAFSRCPNTVRGKSRYCDNHKDQEKKNTYNGKQSTKDNFYQSRSWIKFRNWFRAKNPLCKHCLEKGIVTPMKIVDHIKPISEGGEKFSEDNCQSLCQECHNRKTFGKERW